MDIRPVLIYDGDCAFCQRSLDVGRRHLRVFPEATPYQFADLQALGLTQQQTQRSIRLIESAGTSAGARAVARILMQQPGIGWRVLGRAMSIPPVSWVSAAVYALVSRYRHRLPGGSAACRVPPAG